MKVDPDVLSIHRGLPTSRVAVESPSLQRPGSHGERRPRPFIASVLAYGRPTLNVPSAGPITENPAKGKTTSNVNGTKSFPNARVPEIGVSLKGTRTSGGMNSVVKPVALPEMSPTRVRSTNDPSQADIPPETGVHRDGDCANGGTARDRDVELVAQPPLRRPCRFQTQQRSATRQCS
jgi:hypothetical protein